MSPALAEPIHAITTNGTGSSTAHAITTTTTGSTSTAKGEASRINGRLSKGPTSLEGKARSRRNGCKEGFSGAGIVLPDDAAAEVERRQEEYICLFGCRNAVERELIRQMALGSWRSEVLSMRIIKNDARTCAADAPTGSRISSSRRARWPPAGRRSRACRCPAAAQLGRLRLADRPLDAAGQRPVNRRRGRAELRLDRRRYGACTGPAGPAGGTAAPGSSAKTRGVAPRTGQVRPGRSRDRITGVHQAGDCRHGTPAGGGL